MKTRIASLLGMLMLVMTSALSQQPTELFLRGYSALPAPQKVVLPGGDIEFNDSWTYESGRIARDHIAVRSLLKDLREFHQVELNPSSSGVGARSGARA